MKFLLNVIQVLFTTNAKWAKILSFFFASAKMENPEKYSNSQLKKLFQQCPLKIRSGKFRECLKIQHAKIYMKKTQTDKRFPLKIKFHA